MRSADRCVALAVVLGASLGCGGGGGGPAPTPVLPETTRNVVPLSVGGALCRNGSGAYVNEPCVRVTVCSPATQACQTIDGVLLDTGSFGLRIFGQVLTVPLTPVPAGAGELAECVHYGDLSTQWGPVRMASVVLGGEPPVQVPIHVIDAGFSTVPASCESPDADPASAGFNGILGVGSFVEDCGPRCSTSAGTGIYFACTGGSCVGATVPLERQVQNPVAALPEDDNGLIVRLPPVPAGGAPSAEGTLVLGIGTAADNAPGPVSVLDLDGHGEFRTTVAGTPYTAFADTGSNAFFFEPPGGVSLPECTSDPEWFCPATRTTLSATNRGASGTGGATVSFDIANFDQLSRANTVFPDLGGTGLAGGGFDWGLPFFLGRTVYVGIAGRRSPLGTGPYVAH